MNGIARIRTVFSSGTAIRLMTHVVGGYPTLALSKDILLMMAREGADLIEVQLPFSDPSADGPLIVEANYAALAQKVNTEAVLSMLAEVRAHTSVPLLVMSYVNPLYAYGIDRLIARMVEIGLDGLIVPDYAPDEPELGLIEKADAAGLAFVPLIAPGSSPERAKFLADISDSPFVYAVLRMGVTGRKTELGSDITAYLSMLKKATGKYVAAGFGIRERDQMLALAGHADCGIVGSALIGVIKDTMAQGGDVKIKAQVFIRQLAGK